MEQTSIYNLNQWVEDDRILREDFNADNAKIEAALAAAGNCKIVTGSYVGTGSSGSNNPNTIELFQRPLLLIVCGSYTMLVPGIVDSGRSLPVEGGYDTSNQFTWDGSAIRWYNLGNMDFCQLNTKGETYHYIAVYAN